MFKGFESYSEYFLSLTQEQQVAEFKHLNEAKQSFTRRDWILYLEKRHFVLQNDFSDRFFVLVDFGASWFVLIAVLSTYLNKPVQGLHDDFNSYIMEVGGFYDVQSKNAEILKFKEVKENLFKSFLKLQQKDYSDSYLSELKSIKVDTIRDLIDELDLSSEYWEWLRENKDSLKEVS